MQIAIALFDRLTALDAIGPYEVLQRLPGADLVFVGERTGTYRTDNGRLGLTADATLAEVPSPDVLVVPGGIGTRDLLDPDHPLVTWVRAAHATSTWTTSVCTGSLVLGAAGVLDGVEATTHWAARSLLERHGAVPVTDRVVRRGRVVTAAGVSSGIDMALWLAGQIAGDLVARTLQLYIEYDPQPPYDSGALEKASPEVLEMAARLRDGGPQSDPSRASRTPTS